MKRYSASLESIALIGAAPAEAWYERKFFYLFTCEYCFSHYVTIFFLIITRYTLLYDGWRGYLIAGFSLVWIANQYMSISVGCGSTSNASASR